MTQRQESRWLEALKIIGTITGMVGGAAGVFAIVGYVIILAFANETGIYGRTNFTQQLPFESLFSAIFDWLKFSGNSAPHFLALLTTSMLILAVFLPDLLKKREPSKSKASGRDYPLMILTILGVAVGLLMIVAIGQYDLRQPRETFIGRIDHYLLYSIALPLLGALFILLISRYKKAYPKSEAGAEPPVAARRWYGATSCVFTAVLLLVPFMYGTAFYDLPLQKMRAPIFADSLLNSHVGSMFPNDFTSFYFGQAADQCLFLTNDQSLNGWKIRTIPKEQVRSIELLRSNEDLTLRKYFSIVYQFQNVQPTVNKLQEATEEKREASTEFDSTLTEFLNKN
jgi:hypothetical protein